MNESLKCLRGRNILACAHQTYTYLLIGDLLCVDTMAQVVDKAKNYVTDKVTNMRKPEASLSKFRLKGVSREGVDYLADVSIDNPYSHSIPICEISYVLKSDGRFVLFSICRSIKWYPYACMSSIYVNVSISMHMNI